MSLQDIDCRYAQAKSKTYKLSDGNQLYLLVTTTGKKYWRYDYIVYGKRKTLALGVYPNVSLADARTARKAATEQIMQGIDPVSKRQTDRQTNEYKNAQTVELVFREWHTRFYDTWSERTAHVILRRLEIYIFPHLGAVPQDKVTPEMLLTCLLRAEKNSRDVAERLLKYSYRAFLYAHNTGRKNEDPTKGLIYNLKRYERGHFAAIDINELPALLEAIESEDRRISHQTYLALKLLMLTAVRTNELIKMRWAEVHFELKQWIIPGERMKMKLDHIVPLSKQAMAILLEMKETSGHREWVFPSKQHYKKPMSEGTFIKALERMGYKGKMTGHGFRTVFMGVCKEKLKSGHDVPDRQLAHVSHGGTYDRALYIDERTELMQKYANYIDRISKHHPTQRSNHEQANKPQYSYNITNAYPVNWVGGVSSSPQQYQYLNTCQPNTFRGNSQTGEERPSERLDGTAGTKIH